MSFAKKHNNNNNIFGVDTSDFAFASLDGLYSIDKDAVYKVAGLRINEKSKFDPHPIAIVSERALLVDLPPHLTSEVRNILNDEEDIASIKAGKVGFKVRQYHDNKYNKTCYSVEWVDV